MRTRNFDALIVSVISLLLAATSGMAESTEKVLRLGVILPAAERPLDILRKGFAELGYVEGKTLVIESRVARGEPRLLQGFAEELVKLDVNAIAVVGLVTAKAAQKATTTIPIVFAIVIDPVRDHLVASYQQPRGNTTGITNFDPQQPRKQVELLKQTVPGLARIAIISDSTVSDLLTVTTTKAAEELGLRAQSIRLEANPNLEGAFESIRAAGAGAVLVLDEPIAAFHRKKIADLAHANRIPTLFPRDYVDAGGVLNYSTSVFDAVRRIPVYVDKIFKGAKPADLPIETVTNYQLIVNLKAAAQIGLSMPPDVLKRADQVIQ